MQRIITLMVTLALTGMVHQGLGQTDSSKAVQSIEKHFAKNLDNLVEQWYTKKFFSSMPDTFQAPADTSVPVFPDSVYIRRLQDIHSAIPLTYNSIVRNFIHVYTRQRREKVEKMLGLAKYYFPIFERVFDQYELPLELKYMAIIESALNPRAVSRAGATGMWQFMYNTGKVYGLTINSFVDQRRDPLKSTYAAARYLRDLYNIFGEWDLAIAAYNCGPRNVSKAIYRAGGRRNFWDIYYHLPYETRGYYPAFIAATYVMHYHQDHNLRARPIDTPFATDTLQIKRKLHLKQIAQVLNIPLKQIQQLNPQYRENIIPATSSDFTLRLPMNKTGQFINLQDSIYAYKDSIFFRQKIVRDPGESHFVPQTPSGKAKLHYTVKPGDNLGYIAEWYNVRASDLRYWNNIRGNLIRTGETLVVYVPQDKVSYYKKVNSMSFAEKQKRIGRPVSRNKAEEKQKREEGYIYHKVKYGDTLWEIARQYNGVSQRDLMRLNDLSNAREIQVGQYLKIKKKT